MNYSNHSTKLLKTMLSPGGFHRDEGRYKRAVIKELRKRGELPASKSSKKKVAETVDQPTFKQFLINETQNTMQYGVFRKGGSVGSNNDKPIEVFDDKEEAKAYAKRQRKHLSRGERSYYGMGYVTRPIKRVIKEEAKQKARWQLTSGPNRVRGYDLQVPSKTGGYSNIGFKMAADKPKTTGTIKLYHGATGKDVQIKLDDYDFITETIQYPSPEKVERYVNDNYYVWDDETGNITVEDNTKGNRFRAKFDIDYGPNHLTVHARDYNDEKEVQEHELYIYRDIIDNA